MITSTTWFVAGSAVRYRRWLARGRFLEVALGTPVASDQTKLKRGSLLGLVKWNITPRLGLAVRPDVRRADAVECDDSGCDFVAGNYSTVLAGIEFAW